MSDSSFYLKVDDNGARTLSKSHEYYFQVQGQLSVCDKDYCDFVCWTPKGMHIERIVRDYSFFTDVKERLDQFFVTVILPILLTGRNTSGSSTSSPDSSSQSQQSSQSTSTTKSYCWCGGPDAGRMIGCDNTGCSKEWFHYKCVNITRKPKGHWYCSDVCRVQSSAA